MYTGGIHKCPKRGTEQKRGRTSPTLKWPCLSMVLGHEKELIILGVVSQWWKCENSCMLTLHWALKHAFIKIHAHMGMQEHGLHYRKGQNYLKEKETGSRSQSVVPR